MLGIGCDLLKMEMKGSKYVLEQVCWCVCMRLVCVCACVSYATHVTFACAFRKTWLLLQIDTSEIEWF